MLSASFSQSMVTLFASYSALGGFGLGLLHHHPEYNHQFFINYSDHPHHWASHYDRDLKCQYQTLKTCLTYFSLSSLWNHSEHQQYDLCNAPSWFSRYIVIITITTIILIFIFKRIPLPSCCCGQPRTFHKVHVIILNIGLKLWIIRFHKLQWIAVITCTSCEFWEAFLFFISHIHINHIQSCVHFGADISTLFCLKLSS